MLEGAGLALVGTPEFQRLWAIRQTGFAHLVFPGANHTRLEHSLGAYWVALRMAERLGLSEPEQDLVTSAALLHDLGHGPFSHTFDGPMVEALGYGHEALSRARILGRDPTAPGEVPRILKRFGIDPKEVADLVDPPRRGGARPLLKGLLHGAVDADRIDYLQRDAHYTGVGHGAIDAVRLLETIRESKGRLVFAEKGRSAVEGFLVGRALMYSTVYYHKTVRAAEMMAQAALERIPGYPESARPTFRWTDGEWMTRVRAVGGLSQQLVDALSERRLYKRVHGRPTVEKSPRTAWHRLLVHPLEASGPGGRARRAGERPAGLGPDRPRRSRAPRGSGSRLGGDRTRGGRPHHLPVPTAEPMAPARDPAPLGLGGQRLRGAGARGRRGAGPRARPFVPSVTAGPRTRCEHLDTFPHPLGHGKHRQTRDAQQVEPRERGVRPDLTEGNGAGKASDRLHLDPPGPPRVVRVRLGQRGHAQDAHARTFVPAVVEEGLVPGMHPAKMLKGGRVVDAVPSGASVALEVRVGVPSSVPA